MQSEHVHSQHFFWNICMFQLLRDKLKLQAKFSSGQAEIFNLHCSDSNFMSKLMVKNKLIARKLKFIQCHVISSFEKEEMVL